MSLARPRLVVVLAAFAGAVALLATAAGAAANGASGTVVKLHQTAFGKVLADARGRTLYLFTPDKGRTSTCYGGCAAAWPPLLVHGKLAAGAGLKRKLLGQTMRKDGSHQATYAGHPLYLYAADRKAGETSGEGVGGVWYAVSASGRKIAQAAAAATTKTTTSQTTTSSGYQRGNGY